MAGQPRFRQLGRDIDSAGGEEWFFDELAGGTSMLALANLLECHTGLLYRWVHATEERELLFLEVRAISAHPLVDEAQQIADAADPETLGGVGKAKLQAGIRQWIAARRNRKAYGEEKAGPAQVLQIGQLFLEAAREKAAERNQLPAATETVTEAELLPEDA